MALRVEYTGLKFTDSEYDVQHHTHNALTDAGYAVYGEVALKNRLGGKDCRFDLAIFDSLVRELLCIVEIKLDNAGDATEQLERYRAQYPEVPVIEVRGMHTHPDIVAMVSDAIRGHKTSRLTTNEKRSAMKGVYKPQQYGKKKK